MLNLSKLAVATSERTDAFQLKTVQATFDLADQAFLTAQGIEKYVIVKKDFTNGVAINLGLVIGDKTHWMPKIKNLETKDSLEEAKTITRWKIATFECVVDNAERGWTKGATYTWTVPA